MREIGIALIIVGVLAYVGIFLYVGWRVKRA